MIYGVAAVHAYLEELCVLVENVRALHSPQVFASIRDASTPDIPPEHSPVKN